MGEVKRGFAVEQKALESWRTKGDAAAVGSASGKRPWSLVWEEPERDTEWTRGERYAEKQREGTLPNYRPTSVPTELRSPDIDLLEETVVKEPVIEAVPIGRRLFG